MSVRFVIGRAGAGKTVHCLSAVRNALLASPLEGPRLILLVPEQVSLQIERSLLDGLSAAAAHRAEVLSFRRLAFRILSTTGDGGRVAISPSARAMMLRLLISRNAPELRYYLRAERFPGFIDHLGRTIVEFIEEAVAPEDLPSPEPDEIDDDPSRSPKLHDLKLIYGAYIAALGDRKLDPSQYLEIARRRLSQCQWADGAYLWVDGFAGFSRLERLMLVAMAQRTAGVEITVLADSDAQASGLWELFARPRRTMAELTGEFMAGGVSLDPPVLMSGPRRRFVASPGLQRLERHLFTSSSKPAEPTDEIQIVAAPDQRTEVEFAVAQVIAHVQRSGNPCRYRDIAIIVRDLEPYHALLQAALTARGVPYFIDRRRPIGHHPLIRLLRGLINFAADDYSVGTVRTLLKTGFLGLSHEASDALENHLVATGIEGRAAWTRGDWLLPAKFRQDNDRPESMGAVNAARVAFLAATEPWVIAAADDDGSTGAEWADRIRATLDSLQVDERLDRWAVEADADGDLDRGEAHRQMARDLHAFLDDLAATLGDQRMTLEELRVAVDSGLGQLTLGLAPPMLDQVLVGAIDRSRQPDIRLAIVLGCNDGAFPSVPTEDAILNDDDRGWLEGKSIRLGTPRRQRIVDEALLFYIAATRSRERLVCTYAMSNEEGKELRPSPYLDEVEAACPGVARETIGDPGVERCDWSVLTDRDLAAGMAMEFRRRPDPPDDQPTTRSHWNALYDLARRDTELKSVLAAALRSLDDPNDSRLSLNAQGQTPQPFVASVSQLETYATCPFKHFSSYRLKLRKRAVAPLEAMDVGTVHHAILEKFIDRLVRQGRTLADVDEVELLDELRACVRDVSESMPVLGELSTARDRYLADRSDEALAGTLFSQQRRAQAGNYRPHAAELTFGVGDDARLKGLSITTPKGRHVVLRGVIDRVDLAEVSDELLGVVIDYKRTRDKRLDLSQVFHGLSLQLLGYLLVLAENGATLAGRPIKPAGAFFVSLLDGYQKVPHPDHEKSNDAADQAHRPRGVFDFGRADSLEAASTGWSKLYSIYRNKTGAPGNIDSSDVATTDDFPRLLKRTRAKMADWADQLLDGIIAVNPYRLSRSSPCSWCDYRSVCRFEAQTDRVRHLEKLKRGDVFRRLTAQTEPGDRA